MFTGIITDIGKIRSREDRGDMRLVISTAYDPATIDLGASIACSGACLTVVEKGSDDQGHWFAVNVSGETIGCTAPQMWEAGKRLNLERAMKIGDELGGHIVTGHVDGVGQMVSVEPTGDSITIIIVAPASLAPYIAAKGSITVNGVSLTVNNVSDHSNGDAHFSLNIIPHTQEMTTLDEAAAGVPVNLEIDILARYLSRMGERLNFKGLSQAA
jgi:riboflavin synthase